MEEKIEYTQKPKEGEPWDVVIIGSGPSALTAAVYTTRGAASTLVLGGEKWGGQLMLTTTVDNFPGFPKGVEGPDLIMSMRKQAEHFGAEIIEKNVDKVNFDNEPKEIFTGETKYIARSVIIATGADTRWLNVPGEEKLRGRGVSSCAPCDAPFFKDKKVVVVGGGDSAMEEALVLTKYSPEVIIIHRKNELRASLVMQKKVFEQEKKGKIKLLWETEVVEILGDSVISAVKVKTKSDSEMAKKLLDGNFSDFNGKKLEEKEGYIYWELPREGLFVAIGHIPATQVFKGSVDLDEKGYVKVMGYPKTSKDNGIFVAGDVHDYTYRQAITAAGYGCMAGMEVLKYLNKSGPSW